MNEQIKSFGLLHEDPRETDYILGAEAQQGTEVWAKIKTPDSSNLISWLNDAPENEEQRKNGVETNACVSFSADNIVEYLAEWKRKIDTAFQFWAEKNNLIKNGKFNISDRKTAKGSGTDPNSGNYVRAVDDYLRNFLFCPEDLWPFPAGMSSAEYYKTMPDNVANYHKVLGREYEIQTKFVPPSTENFYGMYSGPAELWEAIQYSPIWASVDGYYEVGNDGLVKGATLKAAADAGQRNYNHRICIRAGQYGKYWEVHDNYLRQIVKFSWDYPFGGCKIMRIVDVKKNPQEDYIQVGPAILYKARGGKYNGQYLGFADGDVLKSIYGDYNKVTPRATYDKLPNNFVGNLSISLK